MQAPTSRENPQRGSTNKHIFLAARLAVCASLSAAALVGPLAAAIASPAPTPAAPISLQQPFTPPTADAILQRFKSVTGGSAWDSVRTLHMRMDFCTHGSVGSSEQWDCALDGRKLSNNQMDASRCSNGFDGRRAWTRRGSDPAVPSDGPAEQADAVSVAYQSSYSYWYPNRLPGKITYLGRTADKGVTYDLLTAQPQGGTPFQMWFDATTGLLSRTVEQHALDATTYFFSKYRPVKTDIDARSGGTVLMPFTILITNGDPKEDTTINRRRVDVNDNASKLAYGMPSDFVPDYQIKHDADSVTVPFSYIDGHILVPIKINGHEVYAFLDTGGSYVISPETAYNLGMLPQDDSAGGPPPIDGSGYAVQADTLEIGDLKLHAPKFQTISAFSSGRAVAIIGSELLSRFVATIDFDASTLTLTRPDAFHYSGQGTIVPFRFHEGKMPLVQGSVDGVSGTFTVDTGDNRGLTLNGPFDLSNMMLLKYHPKFGTIAGYGINGPDDASVVRTKTLTIGSACVHDRVTFLRGCDACGDGADRLVSGTIGNAVLHEFNLVVDYPHERLILQPNKLYGDPDTYQRTGIVFNLETSQPVVADVIPGSPAASAGLAPGDQIVSIDGINAKRHFDADKFHEFNYEPPGTSVTIQYKHPKGKTQTVTLVLRDLV